MNRQPYVSTYTADDWRDVMIQGDARVEWLSPNDARRPTHDLDPDIALVRVWLQAGSLTRYSYSRHEEGHSYSRETITEGEDADGQPGWLMRDEAGGRDCDGLNARRWSGFSPGGLEPGQWTSPARQISERYYDEHARAAGY